MGDGARSCGFCWTEGLPPDSAYCGYCGYHLDPEPGTGLPVVPPVNDGRPRVRKFVLDEGQRHAPGTIVRLIQAAVEPPLYRMVEDELDGRFGRYTLVAAAPFVPDATSPYRGYEEPMLEADLVDLSTRTTDTLIR